MRFHATIAALLALANAALSTTVVPPSKWDYPYPWPIHYHNVTTQQQYLSMAYMDVAPNTTTPTNQTIVLLHGKNFCGATWAETARILSSAGWRVIIPDQIGFCKSSKPPTYQYSLQQLASNTNSLLTALGLPSATILGHSMGGMLATRYALMFPAATSSLILTNPLGLEDWQALGVPWRSIDLLFDGELATNYSSIRAYQQATYYPDAPWTEAYDQWVRMLVSLYAVPDEGRTYAWDMALTTDMVLTHPIAHEFGLLRMPTLLLIGQRDNTAIGKQWSPPEVQEKLGHYDVLGKETAAKIPDATLVEFEGLGHSPQVQDPEAYHEALLGWLGA